MRELRLLNPETDGLAWWESWLWTGSSRNRCEILIKLDESVEIATHHYGMGVKVHEYRLLGIHIPVTPAYGILRIREIWKLAPLEDPKQQRLALNIADFAGAIEFEYFRFETSPHYQHPSDALAMMSTLGYAGWNEDFEVFLALALFVEEILEAIHYMLETPDEPQPSPDAVEVEQLLRMLDKRKFRRVPANPTTE